MAETQGRVTGYGATTFQNFSHTVRGHLELAGKLRGAYTKLFNLFG